MRTNSTSFPKQPNVPAAERRLKICVIYGRTPLPMRRADQMTVAHLLAFLHARGHVVDLFYIDTGGEASRDDKAWIAENTNSYRAYELDAWHASRAFLRGLARMTPLQVSLFSHAQQISEVRAHIAASEYDIVYTYYFRSAEVAKGIGIQNNNPKKGQSKRPVTFLAFQLSQTLNTRRIAANAPDRLQKLFYLLESRLVERYEARIWQFFTRTVLIGKSDVEEIKAACRRHGQVEINNFIYGAHGTDVTRFMPRDDIHVKTNHLVFSGVMRTPTNIQAAQWFARKVWPLILKERPSATWAIVGREPTADVRELGKLTGVTVTGTVPDPSALIAEAAVCVNPMQAGGGMQNKLVEFMACGKAIVATSVANEGIMAPPDTLLIADSPDDFARSVLKLLTDRELASKLGAAARAHILDKWTWEAHFLQLEADFYACLDDFSS
jgi:glycosyltransferase involved in cell wall biosynthesis